MARFSLTGEDILELHHAGIDEKKRRVVLRHQRTGRDDLVIIAGEIVQETWHGYRASWPWFGSVYGLGRQNTGKSN